MVVTVVWEKDRVADEDQRERHRPLQRAMGLLCEAVRKLRRGALEGQTVAWSEPSVKDLKEMSGRGKDPRALRAPVHRRGSLRVRRERRLLVHLSPSVTPSTSFPPPRLTAQRSRGALGPAQTKGRCISRQSPILLGIAHSLHDNHTG